MKMIHSMIRVKDLDKSIEFYEKVIGLSVNIRLDFEGFTLVYLGDGESHFELELTHNHDNTDDYKIGNGYGHLALTAEDIDSARAHSISLGYEPTPIKELFKDGALLAKLFFIQDPDGYMIEILQRHGRYV